MKMNTTTMLVHILIACVLLNYGYWHCEAAPAILLGGRDNGTDSADSPAPVRLHRTLFGILWSCTSTIIICAWTAVHPNVPPPNLWKARWNRLKFMFWMIIAPELVLAWAVRQGFGAREIRNTFNSRNPKLPEWKKWTLTHGHLLQMGGFCLIDPEESENVEPRKQTRSVLTFDYFKSHPDIDSCISRISRAEIEDRSKGDALAKFIAIIQTTWFIIQCVSRGQQRLALTELELITLALASLNAVTFGIWWYKPLGVQEPVKIYVCMEREGTENPVSASQEDDVITYKGVIGGSWKVIRELTSYIIEVLSDPCREGPFIFFLFLLILPIYVLYIIVSVVFVIFLLGTVFLLKVIETSPPASHENRYRGILAGRIVDALQHFRYRLTYNVGNFVQRTLKKIFNLTQSPLNFFIIFPFSLLILFPLLFLFLLLFVLSLVPFFAFLFFVLFIFKAVFGIVTTSSIGHPRAANVPSFYAVTTLSDSWTRMVVFSLFGVLFGGVHCIGWNFKFPTDQERDLWRYTSLAITVIPPIVSMIDFILTTRDTTTTTTKSSSCSGSSSSSSSGGRMERNTIGFLCLDLVATVLLFIYVPARLSLIAQAMALLRNQPPDALISVDWTQYMPHLLSS